MKISAPADGPCAAAMHRATGAKRVEFTSFFVQLHLPDVLDAAAEFLDDPDAEVRHAAARGLSRVSDPRVVAPLARAIEKPRPRGPYWTRWHVSSSTRTRGHFSR